MIEPGRNGHRSGSVAKGRCEAGCFAKNGRPLARWILHMRGKAKNKVVTAVARELVGFIWAIACEVGGKPHGTRAVA